MGRRFTAQMGAPLTAQSIEIASLEIASRPRHLVQRVDRDHHHASDPSLRRDSRQGITAVLPLRRRAHHHKLCIGKFDAHDPTRPLIPEARSIRSASPRSPEPASAIRAARSCVDRLLCRRKIYSHQPFRRRERAMQRFRSMKTLQKFSSVHAQVHNHFNQERHLVTRQVYKQRRTAALAEWRALARFVDALRDMPHIGGDRDRLAETRNFRP